MTDFFNYFATTETYTLDVNMADFLLTSRSQLSATFAQVLPRWRQHRELFLHT